jgi:hypothetical protein
LGNQAACRAFTAQLPIATTNDDRGKFIMTRLKNTGGTPAPRPVGDWFMGMMIGAAIMTMATQAIVLGAGAAIQETTLKGR